MTKKIIEELQTMSSGKIANARDIGHLLELAAVNHRQDQLNDAAFSAKFVINSMNVMKRIGPDGEGYGKLSSECEVHIKLVTEQLRSLLEDAPADVKTSIEQRYLSLSGSAMPALISLCEDLRWYKNYQIDSRSHGTS